MGRRRFLGALAAVTVAAALLDGHLPGASTLLGAMGLYPFLFRGALSTASAGLGIFSFGLLLDGTHISIPFGFNAFFGLACVLVLQMASGHLPGGLPRRPLAAILLGTGTYYAALTAAVPSGAVRGAIFPALLSCAFNGLCWRLLVPRFPQFSQFAAKKALKKIIDTPRMGGHGEGGD
jgi:hypothetical protein